MFTFTAFAGGLQQTSNLENLPRTVDEMFAQKDTRRLKKRVLIRTADGKKIRGYFVRFEAETLVLHERPTGWSKPVTKLVSLKQIKTLQVQRGKTKKLALLPAVSGGLMVLGFLTVSEAILVSAMGAFYISLIAVVVAHAWPSYHTVLIAP